MYDIYFFNLNITFSNTYKEVNNAVDAGCYPVADSIVGHQTKLQEPWD